MRFGGNRASSSTPGSAPLPHALHQHSNPFRPLSRSVQRSSTSATVDGASTPTNGSSTTVKLVAPLRELYKSKLMIRVVYGTNASSKTLTTEYDIRQLRIHESKWLILNLTKENETSVGVNTISNDNADDDDVPPTIRLKSLRMIT